MNPQPKINFDSLCIETTRKCNMSCAFCMRGEPQNRNMNPEAVDRLFMHTNGIYSLTPTGGEPSLNPEALLQIRNSLVKHNVNLSGMYIVTNGLIVPDAFILNCMELLLLTDNEEYSNGIALSKDIFHSSIPPENEQKLKLFSCFRDDKMSDWTRMKPIRLGRAKNLSNYETREPFVHDNRICASIDLDSNIYYIETNMALTVDGDLLTDSDYAYDETDTLKVCNLFEDDWLEKLIAKIQADNIETN